MPLKSSSSPSFGPRYRGSGGYTSTYGKGKGRGRRGLVGFVIALVVLAVLAGGGLYYKKQRDDRAAATARALQAAAVSTVSSYVAAWDTGNYAAAAALVDPADAAKAKTLLAATKTQLHATSFTVTQTGGVSSTLNPGGGYQVKAVIRGLGPVSWSGSLPLVRQAGVGAVPNAWQVAFTPAAIEPDLVPGGKFAYSRPSGGDSRGKVLLDDGSSMGTGIQNADLTANLRGNVTLSLKTDADAAQLGPQYLAGDAGGTSGLEKAFNTTLQGIPGGSLKVVDGQGKTVKTLISLAHVAGKDVKTTLDPKTQAAAEVGVNSVKAPVGALVAIDLRSGHILAMANKPIGGEVRTLTPYPPGSTFKIVTTVAALAAGYGPGTTINCAPSVSIDGRMLHNSEMESFGTIAFAQAFAVSCNTWFAQLATMVDRTHPGLLVKIAQEFGFHTDVAAGVAHDKAETGILPTPGFGGSYPTPKDEAQVAGQSFGQDLVEASPLQMASVVAGAANGTWRQPILTTTSPQASHELPAGTAATLRSFMAGVLYGDGTAAGVGFPGGTIGKTGTAQTGGSDDSWFVGVNGNVAFAAEFDGAGFGAAVAAPACAAFLRALG